nr:MAG TPA: hypothetical protein [Caudoviricetes sp.]
MSRILDDSSEHGEICRKSTYHKYKEQLSTI